MDSSSLFYSILIQWAMQSPVLMAYMVGIILALIHRQRCPGASVLTLCAMVLLGLISLVVPVVTMNLIRLRAELGWTIKQFGFVSSVLSSIWAVGHAVGIGLLLVAVFHRRPAPLTYVPPIPPPSLP